MNIDEKMFMMMAEQIIILRDLLRHGDITEQRKQEVIVQQMNMTLNMLEMWKEMKDVQETL